MRSIQSTIDLLYSVSGVLEPLKLLRKTGKISGEICTIVLDGLCEAEQHR